jgi:hypothetical protein
MQRCDRFTATAQPWHITIVLLAPGRSKLSIESTSHFADAREIRYKMVKPLVFKGDKKPKKRKRAPEDDDVASSSKTTVKHSSEAALDASDDTPTQDDDTWVSADSVADVSGPVIVVLPSEKPSCLACDVTGKVFALELENMIDDDPATAEPHDVRQVWVAGRLAGMETFSLKGHHGLYVSDLTALLQKRACLREY